MNILLLMALIYTMIATLGYVVNRFLRLPWMFTVVVSGMVFAALGLFSNVFASPGFQLLTQLGMLFFLFTIGMDLDLSRIRELGTHIVVGNILLTLAEGLSLGAFFYLVLPEFVSHSFPVALLAGLAFGTVGEVVLVAILKEFGLEHTRFGQLALGIGLTSKFSTSIISENLLFSAGLVAQPLYSAMMAAFILLKPVIVGVFSHELAVSQHAIAMGASSEPQAPLSIPVVSALAE